MLLLLSHMCVLMQNGIKEMLAGERRKEPQGLAYPEVSIVGWPQSCCRVWKLSRQDCLGLDSLGGTTQPLSSYTWQDGGFERWLGSSYPAAMIQDSNPSLQIAEAMGLEKPPVLCVLFIYLVRTLP